MKTQVKFTNKLQDTTIQENFLIELQIRAIAQENCDPALYEKHFDINTPEITKETDTFAKKCWQLYEENLKKYAHLSHLQDNCVFKFLCFFMTKAFCNTSFISHNGARYVLIFLKKYFELKCKFIFNRFDSLFIQSVLLDMEISDIKSLNSGSGLLEIYLPQFNISFIDSIRYMPGSLKKMAERFNLPVKKGTLDKYTILSFFKKPISTR